MIEYKYCGFDPHPFEGKCSASGSKSSMLHFFYSRLTGEIANGELVVSQRCNGQSGGALACQRDIL